LEKIIGRKPVLEALKSGKQIDQVFILYGQHSKILAEIKQLAKKKNVKVSQLSPQKFNKLFPGKNTQGVIATASGINFSTYGEIIDLIKNKSDPLVLIIDSVQDTHNLGAILRTAECAGVDGVFISSRNTAPINETVNKTSAGAVSHLKISRQSNIVEVIKKLKSENFWIVGSKLGNSKNYTQIDYSGPIALVVGNEEKGIRRLVAENCDFLVEIPMKGKIQSLNVSVAAGILLFEILHTREITESEKS